MQNVQTHQPAAQHPDALAEAIKAALATAIAYGQADARNAEATRSAGAAHDAAMTRMRAALYPGAR